MVRTAHGLSAQEKPLVPIAKAAVMRVTAVPAARMRYPCSFYACRRVDPNGSCLRNARPLNKPPKGPEGAQQSLRLPCFVRLPGRTLHFTPTPAYWIDTFEGFCAKLSRQGLKDVDLASFDECLAAIMGYIKRDNANSVRP